MRAPCLAWPAPRNISAWHSPLTHEEGDIEACSTKGNYATCTTQDIFRKFRKGRVGIVYTVLGMSQLEPARLSNYHIILYTSGYWSPSHSKMKRLVIILVWWVDHDHAQYRHWITYLAIVTEGSVGQSMSCLEEGTTKREHVDTFWAKRAKGTISSSQQQ